MVRGLLRLLVFLWTDTQVKDLDNLPREGPALLVANHLGDADLVIGIVVAPISVESIAKVELREMGLLGAIMDAYGFIWVHRGQPDRSALRAVMQAFNEKRLIGITPEARESLSGALEEGTKGAAYIALKAGVPVVPVTFTGTENERIFRNIKSFRRTKVTVTIGRPLYLEALPDRQEAIAKGTELIMRTLAKQLPPAYRGVYQIEDESEFA
jgi:1-acyl-sn-glycerol-3-phosphate acyltransferase